MTIPTALSEDPFGFTGLTYDDVLLLPGNTDVIGVTGQQQQVIVGQAGEAEGILGKSGGNGQCLPIGCWLHR